jgi:hypothetical protein
VILATQEAEIRRFAVQSQSRQIIHKTLSQKHPSHKRAGVVAQRVGPEFKPQYGKYNGGVMVLIPRRTACAILCKRNVILDSSLWNAQILFIASLIHYVTLNSYFYFSGLWYINAYVLHLYNERVGLDYSFPTGKSPQGSCTESVAEAWGPSPPAKSGLLFPTVWSEALVICVMMWKCLEGMDWVTLRSTLALNCCHSWSLVLLRCYPMPTLWVYHLQYRT